jgi:hypothetical protein
MEPRKHRLVSPSPPLAEGGFYETPKRCHDLVETVDDDENFEEVKQLGRKRLGEIASPCLIRYIYKRRYVDKVFGIRKDDDTFMIRNSALTVDDESYITLHGKIFKGTKRLWELITRKKKVNPDLIIRNDLKAYRLSIFWK